MIVISDTNILSSLAAGDALPLLPRLFRPAKICIPPAVRLELEVGLSRGRTYLAVILQAISAAEIEVLSLSIQEKGLSEVLSRQLNRGEREAIALAQSRQALLLSNDKKAVNYCHQQGLRAIALADLLRLLWTRGLLSQVEVNGLIDRMTAVEKLSLSQSQRAIIFAPRPKR
ncbi:MAG: hypothetical protein HC875_06050 [Anaerolineales bacterium]|nr:hypothetical protein [Anaerolineales bacterium]